jgi:hypothetical protein
MHKIQLKRDLTAGSSFDCAMSRIGIVMMEEAYVHLPSDENRADSHGSKGE